MRLSGDLQTVYDEQHDQKRDTTVGAWKKRLWHWGGRSASGLSWYFSNTDSPWVRCHGKVGYERHLGDIVAPICSIKQGDWSFFLDDALAILLLYDWFYATANWPYRAPGMDFEFCMRSRGRCVFLGWLNVKAFALPPQQPGYFCVSCQSWWPSYECFRCSPFHVPSPPAFLYNLSIVLENVEISVVKQLILFLCVHFCSVK